MDELTANRTLLQVVEGRSFSSAASTLGVSVATVTRQVGMLETQLGVRLLNRTTRQLSLTEAGRIYCDRLRRILHDLDTAKVEVSSYQRDVKGTLRVHLRHSVAGQLIVPSLPEFLQENPSLRLNVTLTDERADLIAEGIDVAVWLGSLDDSTLIARRLSRGRMVVCCSPDYAARHGVPSSLDDLSNHNCLIYRALDLDKSWHFTIDGRTQTVAITGTIETDSAPMLISSAINGLGIAMLQESIARKAIHEGRLVRLFPQHEASFADDDTPLFAVYPGTKMTSPKTRAFVDFLVRVFRDV